MIHRLPVDSLVCGKCREQARGAAAGIACDAGLSCGYCRGSDLKKAMTEITGDDVGVIACGNRSRKIMQRL